MYSAYVSFFTFINFWLIRYLYNCKLYKIFFFFSIWVFCHDHSRITRLQGKGEGISSTPHYHFHPLHRYLDISRAITAKSSPLHIGSNRTRTGNLWFPRASRRPLSYVPRKLNRMTISLKVEIFTLIVWNHMQFNLLLTLYDLLIIALPALT